MCELVFAIKIYAPLQNVLIFKKHFSANITAAITNLRKCTKVKLLFLVMVFVFHINKFKIRSPFWQRVYCVASSRLVSPVIFIELPYQQEDSNTHNDYYRCKCYSHVHQPVGFRDSCKFFY